MTIFQNKKTRKFYKLLGTVINTTNAQDGQVMFVYAPLKQEEEINLTFVRERKEFLEKFELIEEVDYEE